MSAPHQNALSDGTPAQPARPRWLRGCVLVAAAALIATVALCALGGAGIRRGDIRPPWVVRRVGPVQLVAITTLTPDCALEFPCGKPINVFDPDLRTYYVVWVVVSWPGDAKPGFSKYRLVMQAIEQR